MATDLTTHMRRALRLAAKGSGRTSPNPMVGAVVVRDGSVVGEGWHRAVGEAHAEIDALAAAGPQADGATLVVTLEPCSHRGRTPPCVDAIHGSRIARVVAAMRDPFPKVDGRGFRALRALGVAVEHGLLEAEARRLNEGFISRVERGRPFVLLKLALTIDGHTAVPGRRYLSSKRALREVHRLRDRYDAVLVGVGTVLADDPRLTVREVRGRDPLRVVLDTEARTPVTAQIVRSRDPQRTVLLIARDADQRRVARLRGTGVLVASIPRAEGGLDLGRALRWLGDQGVNTVLSEAGPAVAAALVRGGLADRALFVVSPLLGGDGPRLDGLPEPRTLRECVMRRWGDDVAIEGYLQ